MLNLKWLAAIGAIVVVLALGTSAEAGRHQHSRWLKINRWIGWGWSDGYHAGNRWAPTSYYVTPTDGLWHGGSPGEPLPEPQTER